MTWPQTTCLRPALPRTERRGGQSVGAWRTPAPPRGAGRTDVSFCWALGYALSRRQVVGRVGRPGQDGVAQPLPGRCHRPWLPSGAGGFAAETASHRVWKGSGARPAAGASCTGLGSSASLRLPETAPWGSAGSRSHAAVPGGCLEHVAPCV